MSALSGNVGASWSFGDQFVPYVNVSTSFETPTTTELVNKADGSGGFNPDLGPQRAVNYEIGARGQPAPGVSYSAAFFLGRITRCDRAGRRDRRAGLLRQRGQDAQRRGRAGTQRRAEPRAVAQRGVHLRPLPVRQRHRRTATGCRACPDHFWRFGLRTALPAGLFLDADQTISSSVAADDANSIIVDGWNAGVTNLRLGWEGDVGVLGWAVPRREQPVGPAVRRLGDAERPRAAESSSRRHGG